MSWLVALIIAMVAGVSSDMVLAAAATPVPFPATPVPAVCQADPLAHTYLADLLSTPVPASPAAEVRLEGVPAREDIVFPVRQVIVEVFACFNAGEPLRAYRLYSDAYLRRILASETAQGLTLLATPYPLDEHEWTSIIDIRDLRVLDDGRIYATVILDPGLIPVQKTFGFFLIEQNGRWLVDDVLDELEFALP